MVVGYVLWALALLSSIALSVQSTGLMAYHLGRGAEQSVTADELADWAIQASILALLDVRPERRPLADGSARTITVLEAPVRVSVQDELGRIDLNHADRGALLGLFRSQDLATKDAEAIVDKVLDWREPGAQRRINGANTDDYRKAGLSYRPRGGPFQSVDELNLVLGVTTALFVRVASALTVYSGRPFVDPKVAPREVLMALPGATSESVRAAIDARSRNESGPSPMALPLSGRAFTIRAEFFGEGSSHLREAVIRLTDDPVQPFWVLSWRRVSAPGLGEVRP